MKKWIAIALLFVFPNVVFASAELVTCPEWNSYHKKYVTNPKKAEALKAEPNEKFLALYRAIASILGSGRMTAELNSALETSGYSDLFDVLLSLHHRGGLPPDFVEAIKLFHKNFKTDDETYIVDIKTQEMLGKLRRSYCK